MTNHPKPSAESLAKADAICKKHGMLPGGYMRDSLAEDLEAFAAEAVEASWLPRCGETGRKSVNGVCPEHGGDGCLMASARLESGRAGFSAAVDEFVAAVKVIAPETVPPNTFTQTWPPGPVLERLVEAERQRIYALGEAELALLTDTLATVRQTVEVTTRQLERIAGERARLEDAIMATLKVAPVPQDPIWAALRAAIAPPPVAEMLGVPIGMDDLTRISRDGP